MYFTALIALKGRLVFDVPEIMQIPDTSMIGSTGGNFGQRHDLMGKGLHWVLKSLRLPVLHQRSVNTDMRNTYPCITLYSFKEACYGLAYFHRSAN